MYQAPTKISRKPESLPVPLLIPLLWPSLIRIALNTSYYTSNLYWGLKAVSETAEQAALIALTLDCSQ